MPRPNRGSKKSASNRQKNRARKQAQNAKVKSTKRDTKTWAEKWGASNVDYTVGKNELADMLKKVRSSTARRVASLKKSGAFSYAAMQFEQAMKKTYFNGQMPDISKMSWQSIERELRSHHQFWASKTSSASGARKEQIEQSKRIWGVDKKGKPLKVMTFDESKAFWSAYDEFNELYKGQLARYDSNRIQQAVGTVMNLGGFWIDDIVALSDAAMEHLKMQSEMSEKLGVDFEDFDPLHPNKSFSPMKLQDVKDENGKVVYKGIKLKYMGV